MTALEKYERIEAVGLWRPTPDEQRRDVIVSIGDASLTITDTRERPLTHWSLPAIERLNPGKTPAIFCPDGDPGETLELAESESEMIAAIEKLLTAIQRGRPRPGRLRLVTLSLSLLSVAALSVFWLPGAVLNHTVSVVPDVKRQEIGAALLQQMERLTGKPCSDMLATPALNRMTQRLSTGNTIVVRGGVRDTIGLPGGTILVNRAIFEDFEEPDVAAGFLIAQKVETSLNDPLRVLLENVGFLESVRLLTTGSLSEDAMRSYAEDLVTRRHATVDLDALLAAFEAHDVKTSPYAYALDPSGEETLELIEADPFVTSPRPVLSDGDWVALQGICGG